jgi:DNA-binding transcriptional regulator YiaG
VLRPHSGPSPLALAIAEMKADFKDGMPIGEDENVDPAAIRRYRTPLIVRLTRERMNLSQVEFAQPFGVRFGTVRSVGPCR